MYEFKICNLMIKDIIWCNLSLFLFKVDVGIIINIILYCDLYFSFYCFVFYRVNGFLVRYDCYLDKFRYILYVNFV